MSGGPDPDAFAALLCDYCPALGRSYPETGGVNESAVHWDLICDLRAGGRLSADGEVVQVAMNAGEPHL